MVDLERNEITDLLLDRQAETLAEWLRQHPGIEVMAPDRVGANADGIRRGAPEAVKGSDRWHLLRNPGDAVRAVVDHHHAELRCAAKQMDEPMPAPLVEETASEASVRTASAAVAQHRSQTPMLAAIVVMRKPHVYNRMGSPFRVSLNRLARRRQDDTALVGSRTSPIMNMPPQEGILKSHMYYMIVTGLPDATMYRVCVGSQLRWDFLVGLGSSTSGPRPGTERNRGSFVSHLLNQVPPVAEVIAVAKRLNALLRRKAVGPLTQIFHFAANTPLKNFAASLRRDIPAIQAALDLPWTTNPVEG